MTSKVGDKRLLLLVNAQFRRVEDFGFWKRGVAEERVFGRYTPGFSFEEFSCRGEVTRVLEMRAVNLTLLALHLAHTYPRFLLIDCCRLSSSLTTHRLGGVLMLR